MEKWKKSEFQNTCVKIEHVTKRFGEDLVLKEVNLTLKVGQVYGVVGNNGSGKTVLMKCICGFIVPEIGQIKLGRLMEGHYRKLTNDEIKYLKSL